MDSGFLFIFLLALLPGIGNFAGGLIAEFSKPTDRLLSLALHAASGIVLGVIAIELVPEALRSLAVVWLALAFAAGGVAYTLLERLLQRLQAGASSGRTRMWMIYSAVAVDLTSDGVLIGTGSAVSSSLALVLAAGQMLADVPEGYAAVANFRDKKVGRARRLLASASFVIYPLLAAVLAYTLLRGAGEPVQMAALMFIAGLLALAAVEDMLQEAHAARVDTQRSALAFVAGFALFALVSAGLETVVGTGSQESEQGARAIVPSSVARARRSSPLTRRRPSRRALAGVPVHAQGSGTRVFRSPARRRRSGWPSVAGPAPCPNAIRADTRF